MEELSVDDSFSLVDLDGDYEEEKHQLNKEVGSEISRQYSRDELCEGVLAVLQILEYSEEIELQDRNEGECESHVLGGHFGEGKNH